MQNTTHRVSSSERGGNPSYRYLFHTSDPRSPFDIDRESFADTRHTSHYSSTVDLHKHEHLIEQRRTTSQIDSSLNFRELFYRSDSLDRNVHFCTAFVLSSHHIRSVVHSVNRMFHNRSRSNLANSRARTIAIRFFQKRQRGWDVRRNQRLN